MMIKPKMNILIPKYDNYTNKLYSIQKRILTLFVFLLIVASLSVIYTEKSYSADYTGEKLKLVTLTSESTTVNYTSDGATNGGQGATLMGFTPAASTGSNSCQSSGSSSSWSSSTSYYTVTTVDGYSGIQIASGIILIPSNGSFTGSVATSSGTSTAVLTTDSYGQRTVSGGTTGMFSPNRWCSTVVSYATLIKNSMGSSSGGSGNVTWSVYASASATAGTYTIPNVYWTRAQLYGNNGTKYILSSISGKTVYIAPPLTCNITPPSPINFGAIDLTYSENNKILAYDSGNLTITCAGGDSGASSAGTIQITGDIGRYSDTLKMNWDNSSDSTSTPAEIRGFIGMPLPAAGECNGKNNGYTNYIIFNASEEQQISIGSLSSGTNTIPYSFSLCSNGTKADGDANAQAVINLTWN